MLSHSPGRIVLSKRGAGQTDKLILGMRRRAVMEARVAGRAQDLAGDVPGAGGKRCPRAQVVYPGWTFTTHHTACCPTVTLQAELGLGNWAAVS